MFELEEDEKYCAIVRTRPEFQIWTKDVLVRDRNTFSKILYGPRRDRIRRQTFCYYVLYSVGFSTSSK
jgi:hypothetical protein